jgi:hypothetical protein
LATVLGEVRSVFLGLAFGLVLAGCHADDEAAPAQAVTRVGTPQKVFELLGDLDLQYSPPAAVPGQTLTRYGIVGADLGYPLPYQGKTLFFFADVVGTSDAVTNQYADAVGWTTQLGTEPFAVDFFPPSDGSLPFLPITVNGLLLGADDGPSSAFVDGDDIYALFVVGNDSGAIDPVTGLATKRATGFLGVSHDGARTFSALFDLPRSMVSTQALVVATPAVRDADWGSPQTLLVWGLARGALVLAAAPFEGLADPGWRQSWRWWTGDAWSPDPENAAPAYPPDDCAGNYSVTYVAALAKWLLVERCGPGNPYLLGFRVADLPVGPWSDRSTWFDPVADLGLCHFVHRACSGGASCCDEDTTGHFGDGVPGHVYSPRVIPQLDEWDPSSGTTTFYSLMSTGNPYTVVLMQTQLHGPTVH